MISPDREGRPLKLLKIEDGEKISLDNDVLQEFIERNQNLMELNIVVLSIFGNSRNGKSFLLNFFLRFLTYLKNSQESAPTNQTPSSSSVDNDERSASDDTPPSWMGDENTPLKGFEWQHGVDSVTSGIFIWSEAFVATLPNGEKIAVILLDTQGLSDLGTTFEVDSKIYALSTLMSSVSIFNLMQRVSGNDLQMLKLLTDYSSLMSSKVRGSIIETSVFQKLLFLIRDWPCNHQFPYGSTGGNQFVHQKILNVSDDNQPAELKTIRERINSDFSEVTGFLMPYPGEKVTEDPNSDGKLSDIKPNFKICLGELLASTLTPENLVLKKINDEIINLKYLLTEYLPSVFDALNSENALVPKHLLHANVELYYKRAFDAAMKTYKESMGTICSLPSVEPSTLKNKHEESSQNALKTFDNYQKFNSDNYTSIRKKLEEDILKIYKDYSEVNDRMKKTVEKLQKLTEKGEEYKQKIEENKRKIRHLERTIKEVSDEARLKDNDASGKIEEMKKEIQKLKEEGDTYNQNDVENKELISNLQKQLEASSSKNKVLTITSVAASSLAVVAGVCAVSNSTKRKQTKD